MTVEKSKVKSPCKIQEQGEFWMTSASELFHISRRSRFGLGSRHVSNLELPEPDRSFHRRHHGTTTSAAATRFRHDLDSSCHPLRRRLPRQHHHRPSASSVHEHDTVRVDEGSGQFFLDNNGINLDTSGGLGNRGRRQIANETLPGAVLLARERLLERLRGVSLSANRRNTRVSSRSNRNGRVIGDANEDHWDTETLRETLDRVLYNNSVDQSDQLPVTTSKKRPPGLAQSALTHLQLEIFTESINSEDGEFKMLRESQECSICLESFADGDELVCLPCAHKFHFVCLEPWVRTCGDCPYCRREVVVSFN